MNKYIVIFRIPVRSVDDWTKNISPEERKKQGEQMMSDWKTWSEKNKAAIVDGGTPLGKTKTVTKDGIKDTRNDLNYMMTIQAASHDEAAKIVSDNPHLNIPTSYVDVMEVPHMGM